MVRGVVVAVHAQQRVDPCRGGGAAGDHDQLREHEADLGQQCLHCPVAIKKGMNLVRLGDVELSAWCERDGVDTTSVGTYPWSW
jgi:hypothetical protein